MSLSSFAIILAMVELLIGLPLFVAPQKTTGWLVRLTQKDILYRLVGAVFLATCALALAENPSVDWSLAGLIRLLA
jgi:threonine/homoserine/homoserine lactone efflux protein